MKQHIGERTSGTTTRRRAPVRSPIGLALQISRARAGDGALQRQLAKVRAQTARRHRRSRPPEAELLQSSLDLRLIAWAADRLDALTCTTNANKRREAETLDQHRICPKVVLELREVERRDWTAPRRAAGAGA